MIRVESALALEFSDVAVEWVELQVGFLSVVTAFSVMTNHCLDVSRDYISALLFEGRYAFLWLF